MADRSRQLKLGVFLYPTGHHLAGWRHPKAHADGGMNLPHYVELARKAEQGKLDFVFFAGTLGARDAADVEAWSHTPKYTGQFEPLTLLSALAVVTKRIGLVTTATTRNPLRRRNRDHLALTSSSSSADKPHRGMSFLQALCRQFALLRQQ